MSAGVPAGSRGAAPGSRARSRELGYAQAMHDVWELARAIEKDYKAREQAAAAAGRDRAYPVAYGFGAWAVGQLAGYAFTASVIHDDQRCAGSDIGWWMRSEWRDHPAPAELPGTGRPSAPRGAP